MNSQLALGLPAAPPSGIVVINARCTLRTEGDQRVIVVGGLPVYHYGVADAVAETYAMVMLVDSGFAQQAEVARAFGRCDRTVRRHQALVLPHVILLPRASQGMLPRRPPRVVPKIVRFPAAAVVWKLGRIAVARSAQAVRVISKAA